MLPNVDAVMMLSVDGRLHPGQSALVFAAKKPVFIDKPVAASLADVIAIYRQAEATGTPCFSSSALRYGATTVATVKDPKIGRILGCDAWSNSKSILPAHPDLFYYGIHGCEALFTLMGPGCETVSRVRTPAGEMAVGTWKDGRLGSFGGILQGQAGFGATVFGEKGIAQAGKFEGYEPLLGEIVTFFKTGKAPIPAETTIEIYAFMEAADESLRQGGRPVSLASVLEIARKQAATPRAEK
jgi:predicted dehydrogenase